MFLQVVAACVLLTLASYCAPADAADSQCGPGHYLQNGSCFPCAGGLSTDSISTFRGKTCRNPSANNSPSACEPAKLFNVLIQAADGATAITSCISSGKGSVTLLLPSKGFFTLGGLTTKNYKINSLSLAGVPANSGSSNVDIKGKNRLRVSFDDTTGVIAKAAGTSVPLTGVAQFKDQLNLCFMAMVKVCNADGTVPKPSAPVTNAPETTPTIIFGGSGVTRAPVTVTPTTTTGAPGVTPTTATKAPGVPTTVTSPAENGGPGEGGTNGGPNVGGGGGGNGGNASGNGGGGGGGKGGAGGPNADGGGGGIGGGGAGAGGGGGGGGGGAGGLDANGGPGGMGGPGGPDGGSGGTGGSAGDAGPRSGGAAAPTVPTAAVPTAVVVTPAPTAAAATAAPTAATAPTVATAAPLRRYNIQVFDDSLPPTGDILSRGFVKQFGTDQFYWGEGNLDDATIPNMIVTFDAAAGRLMFDNPINPKLNLLSYGAGKEAWVAGANDNVNYDILADSTSNPSVKTPQTGITSDSATDPTFYEASLWSVKAVPDPAPDSTGTVQELFVTWINPDGTPQKTFFAIDDTSIAITDDVAKYQLANDKKPPSPTFEPSTTPARLVLRPIA